VLVEEYLEVEGATELFPVVFPALELDGSALEVDLSLSTMNPVEVFDEFLKIEKNIKLVSMDLN
jgi:hypothetical protein